MWFGIRAWLLRPALNHLGTIIMDQAELAQKLVDLNAQAKKVAAEQAAALQVLKDELANGGPVSDAVTAALADLGATIQTEDDLNPDAPAIGSNGDAAAAPAAS